MARGIFFQFVKRVSLLLNLVGIDEAHDGQPPDLIVARINIAAIRDRDVAIPQLNRSLRGVARAFFEVPGTHLWSSICRHCRFEKIRCVSSALPAASGPRKILCLQSRMSRLDPELFSDPCVKLVYVPAESTYDLSPPFMS